MPTPEETQAERALIIGFAAKMKCEVLYLQGDQGNQDNGKTDGIIDHNGKKISVEARRKGYPNYRGHATPFEEGWQTRCLVDDDGIFLNELTINNHQDFGFTFVVEIKGFKPRFCSISPSRVKKLLEQEPRSMKSTNSGVKQSVKNVPLDWFREY